MGGLRRLVVFEGPLFGVVMNVIKRKKNRTKCMCKELFLGETSFIRLDHKDIIRSLTSCAGGILRLSI